MTDSANNPLAQGVDQAPAGLDDLAAYILSGEKEFPNELVRRKKRDTTMFLCGFRIKGYNQVLCGFRIKC